jgi:uncharacterized protein (DUF362 family)
VGRGTAADIVKSAVRAAAEAATDFSWLSAGDRVFIKPALNSGNPYPATTSGDAVAAMVALLKEKGAGRVIVGDMSGIEHVKLTPNGLSGSTRRLMDSSGMAQVVQAAGAEIHFFEESGWHAFYEEFPTGPSHWKRGIMMPNILKDVDHIIPLDTPEGWARRLDPDNCRALCVPCHNKKHGRFGGGVGQKSTKQG